MIRPQPYAPALVFLAGLALLAPTAQAVEYSQVQPAASKLEFTFKQMGVPVPGHFKRFDARLRFDPARPEQASASFSVDLASIDAGSPEANAEVAGKQWFDLPQFGSARFVSSQVRPLGGQRYEVRGTLNLKGQTREVVATFLVKEEAGRAVFTATLPLKRLEFGVGAGPWGDTSIVADQVDVRLQLLATPGK